MIPLTIITINYNDAQGLKKTMASVERQTWNAFEHIIIDGNSSDNSLEVIKSFNYNNLSYICESDTGIYNAMNKGIKMAKGKYLLFLNSGDYLFNGDVLLKVNKYFNEGFSILSGNIVFDEDGGRRLREHPEKITFSYLVGNAISHPSTFIKSSLFNTYGNYDENYKIVSDWAFFVNVLGIQNESYKKIPETISVFDTKGISSNVENLDNVNKEREKVLSAYFPRIFNNENDTYIFKKFIETNKRFKYLKIIDDHPFIRKIVTIKLGAIVWVLKLFSRAK